jgi:hypothetical protein
LQKAPKCAFSINFLSYGSLGRRQFELLELRHCACESPNIIFDAAYITHLVFRNPRATSMID